MKKILWFLAIICLSATSCISISRTSKKQDFTPDIITGSRTSTFPLKIGVLADSHITTKNGTQDYQYRKRIAGELAGVAIRPAALEHTLAEHMLEYALNKLVEEEVDIIIYLGDGANSGGADEINRLFKIFKKYRQDHPDIPIFMVIGNHDYLGVGNTSHKVTRHYLLHRDGRHDNPSLSKYEVIEKISDFNHGNKRVYNGSKIYKYTDNFPPDNSSLDDMNGLYLAGQLLIGGPDEDSVQILLVDTSDYKDVMSKPEAGKLKFYGDKGSISYVDGPAKLSQISYITNSINENSPPAFRFVASHYPPESFKKRFSISGSNPVERRLGLWLLRNDKNKSECNYWLSAHSHVMNMSKSLSKIKVSKGSFLGVNIGSTIDHRAHVAVIEAMDYDNVSVDDYVGFREILLFDDREYFAKIVNDIREFGVEHGKVGKTGITLLGLNKDYQNSSWSVKNFEESERYLNLFIKGYPGEERAKLRACLAYIAAAIDKQ